MRPVIVVEGTSDINKVSNLFDADFVSTNGSQVSRETLNYIKELSKTRTIILLLDPDYPGMRIRRIIQNEVPTALNAYVDRKLSIKGKKLGVCECDKNEIIRAINEVFQWKVNSFDKELSNITTYDLMELGLVGANSIIKREKLSKKIPIGKTNGKTLLKRLKQLQINKDKLIEILKEIENDC